MMSRAIMLRWHDSSSDDFMGSVAWIQMLPSSSSGMNSRPTQRQEGHRQPDQPAEDRQREPGMRQAPLQPPQVGPRASGPSSCPGWA